MHPLVIDDFDAITKLLESTKRIAVLGIKTEEQADQPAFYVPQFLVEMGFDVVPVPVYYPDVTTILGAPVYRKVAYVLDQASSKMRVRRGPSVPPSVTMATFRVLRK